jgi:transcriptional regulator with XRE-family HTH domain
MKRDSLAGRALSRVQQLVETRGFSQETLAPHLGVSGSAVSKILNGKNKLSLDHIDGFCVAFQMTASELLVEPGSLIQPLSPIESELLAVFRQMATHEQISLLTVLQWRAPQVALGRQKRPRLGRTELTAEQQQIVDFYARSNEEARNGVLQTLRESAKHGDAERGRLHRRNESD